jgi:hypothetical protein
LLRQSLFRILNLVLQEADFFCCRLIWNQPPPPPRRQPQLTHYQLSMPPLLSM